MGKASLGTYRSKFPNLEYLHMFNYLVDGRTSAPSGTGIQSVLFPKLATVYDSPSLQRFVMRASAYFPSKVTSIDLSSLNYADAVIISGHPSLGGPIPSFIYNIPKILVIDFNSNGHTGTIPSLA